MAQQVPKRRDARPFLAGVVGWPVDHSLSPAIFRHWFARHGVEGDYVRLPVAPGDLPTAIAGLARAGFRGVNVTAPHKREALSLADEASAEADAVGAANVLIFQPNGRTIADNSDTFGFIASLRAGAPDWTPRTGPALVIGAGGAARAIIHALARAGVPEIRIANRTTERAEELAASLDVPARVIAWNARSQAVPGAALIVNATNLGMTGWPPLTLDLSAAHPGTVVIDIVYRPLETPLLAAARRQGLVAVDGLGMLLHQARPAFRAWFGIDPEVDEELRQIVLEAMG